MARIAGVDLPREKRVEIGLTYIFGIGRSLSNEILNKTGVNPDTRVKDLTDDEVARLGVTVRQPAAPQQVPHTGLTGEDRTLLRLLAQDGRTTTAALAASARVSPSASQTS